MTLATASAIVFRNATIIDGEEDTTPYVADLLVGDGVIRAIGPNLDIRGDVEQVDALGLSVCPGFIDMHAHSDLYLLTHPEHEAKVSQGCTTELIGQDGLAYAPILDDSQMAFIRNKIAGWNGNPSEADLGPGGGLAGKGIFGWRSVGEYLDCLETNGTATNVLMLVPQGNLRLLACGPDNRPATPPEVETQLNLLRISMREGAVGMSSGLTYAPGMYASTTNELQKLCSVLANEFPRAFYAPHHRSYGHNALEAYDEMITMCETVRCPLHLTHALMNFRPNGGRAGEMLAQVDHARARGADVTLDTYPYTAGNTFLASLLPTWAAQGDSETIIRTLADPIQRERLRDVMEVSGSEGAHGVPIDWDEIQVGTCKHPDLKEFSGRRIGEIARALSKPPIGIFCDILIKDSLSTSCTMHVGHEDNVQLIMRHHTHCGGSDAILHGEHLHPRAYGTFPRFIGHYARDLGLMSVSEMIAHLTSRPAKRLSIYPHRGVIRVGSAADLVLFDLKAIKDAATFESSKQRSRGISWVLVNGHVAMRDGKLTGLRAGQVLRREWGNEASGESRLGAPE